MRKSKHQPPSTAGHLTVLSLALTAALASTTPAMAVPGPQVISSSTTNQVSWTNSDLTVNSGVSISSGTAVSATGSSLGTLSNNNGSIIGSGSGNGINNSGTIGALTNSGLISGSAGSGIFSSGSITALTNNAGGTISANGTGIYNAGSIGTLINNAGGTISANAGNGINNVGTIGTLSNRGLITGSGFAIFNSSSGTISSFTNSGTIAGNIRNDARRDLTINGGTGSTFGTLTGSGSGVGSGNIGSIRNTASNLIFGSGNQLLNDNIVADDGDSGRKTVANSAGVLQVNNQISITGNYVQSAAATLKIGVGDSTPTTTLTGTTRDSGYGRLTVSGSATIAAGSAVTLAKLNSYAFAQGQRFVVVVANTTGTNYNAGSLVYTATGFSGTVTGTSVVDGGNTDLLLTLSGGGSSSPINSATAPNAVSSLTGVFNYAGTNAALINLSNAAAALGSTGEANRAGAQLSPTATTAAATQAVTAPTQAVLGIAAAHVDGLRVAQAQSESGSGVSAGESANSTALWGQAFGGQATQNQRDNVSGYHAGYNGLLIGADTLITDNWRVGGLGSYANTSVANDGDNTGSSTHVTSYGLIGYAGYAGQQWYADFSAGAVQHQYNTMRAISFTGFSGGAAGQHNGMQYVASAQAGYPIKVDALMPDTTLTPIAGLTYSTLHQDAYTETGGNGAALQVAALNSSSLKSDIGAKLERSFATAYGQLVPSAQLSWRHEYRNSRLQSVANYAADTTGATSFTTLAPSPVADTGVLTLGVTLKRSENLSLIARYTIEAASGYIGQTADVRLRWQF